MSFFSTQFAKTTMNHCKNNRQRKETLSMIHDSFPALLSSWTADRTKVCAAVNMDLQCIICIANSNYAVKTSKDEVTCDTYWNFYKKWKLGHVSLKTGDFEIKRKDGRQPFKTVVSRLKRKNWNICLPCYHCSLLPPIRAAEIVECVGISTWTEIHKISKAWALINHVLPQCFRSYRSWLNK